MTSAHDSTLALRPSHPDDAPALRRLADLDDAPPLDGEILLALVDGEPVAAVSLGDGRVVADPFRPTADAVTLLSLRAAQLGWRRRPRRGLPLFPRLRAA